MGYFSTAYVPKTQRYGIEIFSNIGIMTGGPSPTYFALAALEFWCENLTFHASAAYLTRTFSKIRSFYRVVELSQGYQGHLATTEAFFYGLDTLPLFLAISIYTPFWPGRFIRNESSNGHLSHNEMKTEGQTDSI